GGDGDDRTFGQPLLQIRVSRLAVGQSEPPAVVVDHGGHVIRIVERGRAAIERGIAELPLRRRDLPDQLGEIVSVLVVAGPAALGREVVLVPPLQLRRRGNGIRPASWLPIRYPLTATSALHLSGQSAATMSPVRAPQSKPPRIAFSILSASMRSTTSPARAAGWPFRTVSPARKRVEP